MLAANVERVLARLGPGDVVVDVGGWARPFRRADWVIDHQPYATRGVLGSDGDGPERFSAATWVARDICDREPYPFADKSVDFVICSQTLEDVRDPVWVCRELARIGRAGYLEVPSRLEEQCVGVQGPWAGWSHHRWLCDVGDGTIEFAHKPHLLHARPSDHFPPGFAATLAPEERAAVLWWEGTFTARERFFADPAELDAWLAGYVRAELEARGGPEHPSGHRRRWRGRRTGR